MIFLLFISSAIFIMVYIYGHIGSLAFYDETMRLMCVPYMYYSPCADGDLVKKNINSHRQTVGRDLSMKKNSVRRLKF